VSRRLAVLVAIALVGLGVGWFFTAFERLPVTEHVPPSGEARVRDFLAAERFAERMGLRSRELRSLPELDKLAPGILLVPNRRQSIDATRAAQLIAWAQAGNHLVVEAELPGIKKEDIHVTIEGNQVTIGAESKRETEQKDRERVLRSERFRGNLYRSFTLPVELDEAGSTAKFENGILELTLARKQQSAGRKLAIQ